MPSDTAIGTPDEPKPLPPPATSIDTLSSVGFLQTVWKRNIRPALKANRFSNFYLATDPVQYAAYEWGLTSFLNRLSEDLRNGAYTPDTADIFRGAKSTGLSRPLAFLSPRDALVFRAIVLRAEPDLRKDMRPWIGAHQKDTATLVKFAEHLAQADRAEVERAESPHPLGREDPTTEYADFFDLWMRKQGIIKNITENRKFVVESDVANYFSSIDLRIVQEYLAGTSLHRDVVRLLVHLIRNVLRHPLYAEAPALGLPQELTDASRYIAHGLLTEVDREFDDFGARGFYARFMDDFVIGVDDRAEGERLIATLQRKLENLGLYPNPAKTRIIPADEYLIEVMASENAYLEEVDLTVKGAQSAPPLREIVGLNQSFYRTFIGRANEFREMAPRPKRWDRVLRRYYRYQRQLRLSHWLPHVAEDVMAFPDSAGAILEYVRSFPITSDLVQALLGCITLQKPLYGDVPLMVLETISTAPNEGYDSGLSDAIVKHVYEAAQLVRDTVTAPRALADWILAACLPVLAKFAPSITQGELVGRLLEGLPVQSVARLQAFPIQIALGQDEGKFFQSELAGLPWGSVLSLDFVKALNHNDEKARGVAIGLLQPEPRLLPNRFQLHTRALILLPILARHHDRRLELVIRNAIRALERNPTSLRDERAITLLRTHISEGT